MKGVEEISKERSIWQQQFHVIVSRHDVFECDGNDGDRLDEVVIDVVRTVRDDDEHWIRHLTIRRHC